MRSNPLGCAMSGCDLTAGCDCLWMKRAMQLAVPSGCDGPDGGTGPSQGSEDCHDVEHGESHHCAGESGVRMRVKRLRMVHSQELGMDCGRDHATVWTPVKASTLSPAPYLTAEAGAARVSLHPSPAERLAEPRWTAAEAPLQH